MNNLPTEKRPVELIIYPALQASPGPFSYLCEGRNERRRGRRASKTAAGVWKEEGRLERAGGVAPKLDHPSAIHTGISIPLTCSEGLLPPGCILMSNKVNALTGQDSDSRATKSLPPPPPQGSRDIDRP